MTDPILSEDDDSVLRFKPSAYLQRLLGRELLSSDHAAVAELVKNAYDAGATEVEVVLQRDSPQVLTISDNGIGMSLDEFEQFWMSPGYSEKSELKDIKVNSKVRVLLGEKGIGRFAADKLAAKLVVITKKKGEDEALWVNFDWQEFEAREKKIWEIPIEYSFDRHADLTKYQSGTILELQGLRHEWNRRDWRRLRKELQNIVNPGRSPLNFNIVATALGWESGQVQSPFEVQEGYRYEFSIARSGSITWKMTRPKNVAVELNKQAEEASHGYISNSFGAITGRFYYLDKPQAVIKIGFEPGIGIYRDGFRVEPYGRAEDDWLQVQSFKASRQGHAPTPNKLFGFVEISRNKNPQLRDITSREGLQDTSEFAEFREAVIERYRHFAKLLEEDRLRLDVTSPQIAGQRAQVERQSRAEAFTEMATKLAHQLRQPLGHIRMSSTNLRDLLEQRGLLDADSTMLTKMIEENVIRMNENIDYLYRLAKVLKEESADIDLCEFIHYMLMKHKENFELSGVRLALVACEDGLVVRFGKMALEFILDNFLTNAMRATLASERELKAVILEVTRTDKGYRVSVADNGNGIAPQHLDNIFKDFLPGDHKQLGMGLWWSQVQAKENGAECYVTKSDNEGTIISIEF